MTYPPIDRLTDNPRRGRGLFIALIGPDGSGKSTLAQELARALGARYSSVRHVHGGFDILPTFSRIANLMTLGRFRRAIPNEAGIANAGMVRPKRPVRAFLYHFYYTCDFALGRIRLRRWLTAGSLVLADRYYYDYYYQLTNRRLPRSVIRLFQPLVREPDVVFSLIGDPQIIHGRKPELTVEEIAIQNDRIEQVPGIRNYVLSTDQGVTSMVGQALTIIDNLSS